MVEGFTITIRQGAVRQMLKRGERQAAIVLARVITQQAQLVMRESKRRVPLLNGILRSSGQVRPARVVGLTRVEAARLSYGGAASAYAFYQHREHNPPFHYSTPGTGPGYLANPLKERTPMLSAAVKAAVAALLKS